jgi:hypothetical protein
VYRWVPSRVLAAILTLAITLAVAVGLLIVREHQQGAAASEARAAQAARAKEAWAADLARAKEEQAERKRIAAENAAARAKAQEAVTAKRLAEERAAKEAAEKLAAQRKEVAAERAAKRAAELAEQKRLAAEKKERHVVHGTVLVPDVRGALVIRAGGRRGQALGTLTEAQRTRYDSLLASVQGGARYGCGAGAGGRWADVTSGAQVTVEDGDGNVLTKGSLTGGTLTEDGCSFEFAIEVGYAEYYRVRVTQRGPATWSRDEMESQGWRVAATL